MSFTAAVMETVADDVVTATEIAAVEMPVAEPVRK